MKSRKSKILSLTFCLGLVTNQNYTSKKIYEVITPFSRNIPIDNKINAFFVVKNFTL